MNQIKTFALLAAMTALFGMLGLWLGGTTGMLIALVIAGAMNLFSYWNADKMVLRLYRAEVVDETHPNSLIRTYVADVAAMAAAAGLPRPVIAIAPNAQPNAFATGRDPAHAAVCATTGLLERLSREEVRGVMAHELAHVKNRDTLTMTVTATLAGAISALANFALLFGGGHDEDRPAGLIGTLAMMILAPMAAGLVQMAISRSREYEADRVGAEIAGSPLGLASALQSIEADARRSLNAPAERNPATAHMFIINPLNGRGADNLFSTHPATANRVRALLALPGGTGERAPAPALGRSQPGTRVPTTPSGPWG